MTNTAFWTFFRSEVGPKLNARESTFTKIFEYLDGFERPPRILETGCAREAGNWAGDGCSTLLFDRYSQHRPGTRIESVDINPNATEVCKRMVSERVHVHTGDSVAYLRALADAPGTQGSVDLLYLDSFDVNFNDPLPSAIHHMKELVAAAPLLHRDTLVVVDDAPTTFTGIVADNGGIQLVLSPQVGGKGRLVADFAQHIGAKLFFQSYQCGWTGLRTVDPANGQARRAA